MIEKQYRRGVDDFVYELPAGWLNDGETPEQAALRELKEETGYIGEAALLRELYPQPAFCSMLAYVVLVKVNENPQIEIALDHDESIEYEFLDIERIKTMIKSNEIKDMGLLAALSLNS